MHFDESWKEKRQVEKEEESTQALDRYCLHLRHAWETCALMKVEKKEERQVEREREDKSAQCGHS